MSESPVTLLEPFRYFADRASAIRPLGGSAPSPDPKYGFHTEYYPFKPGPLVIHVSFEGLTVSHGELCVQLQAYSPGRSSSVSLVDSTRQELAAVLGGDAEIILRTHAVADVTYALYGYFSGATDACATSIRIEAREMGSGETDTFERTSFGTDAIEYPSRLVDGSAPSFADPVSQPMTRFQLSEPTYRELLETLGHAADSSPRNWCRAFIVQALDRYGMLKPGARGLCLTDGEDSLCASLAQAGCTIVAPEDAVDPDGSLSEKLRGFDFLWSTGRVNQFKTIGAAKWFMEGAMHCLRPGGLAVHMFDTLPELVSVEDEQRHAINRRDVERLAVTLIARSHEVAQLKFGTGGDEHAPLAITVGGGPAEGKAADLTPFGLIARKGLRP